MDSMLTAYNWIREAISTKGLAPLQMYYLVKDGMIYGTDGRMTAGHPFPYETPLEFCAVAAPTEKLLNRLPEPIKITVKDEDEEVVFSSGRLRGAVKTLPPSQWAFPLVGQGMVEMPTRLLPGLKVLRPFISDNASRPWALCIRVADGNLYATNNVSVGVVVDIDMEGVELLIPNWAIDFVLTRTDGLVGWSHHVHSDNEPNTMAFHWANGAWMQTKLVVDDFPKIIDSIVEKAGEASHPITDEWRAAYEYVAGLTESHMEFHADRIVGKDGDLKSSKMTATADIQTLMPKNGTTPFSAWDPRFLEPVMKVATHFDPDAYPDPCPFRGDGVVGVVMGRRG